MKRLSMVAVYGLLAFATAQAEAETWYFLEHPDLVNRSPGPDRLWETGDDINDLGGGLGANAHGASTLWRTTIFTGGVLDSYWHGSQTLATPLPAGPGSALLISSTVEFDVLGLVEDQPGDPVSSTPSSTWTVAPGQNLAFDDYIYEPAGYRFLATGFVLYPGDDPNVVIGAGAIANNVAYLMTLLPATWQVAAFFDGHFADLAGVPNGFGEATGLMYTSDVAAVPLPGSIALLGTPLLLLPRCRRRLERHRVRRQT